MRGVQEDGHSLAGARCCLGPEPWERLQVDSWRPRPLHLLLGLGWLPLPQNGLCTAWCHWPSRLSELWGTHLSGSKGTPSGLPRSGNGLGLLTACQYRPRVTRTGRTPASLQTERRPVSAGEHGDSFFPKISV